MKYVYLILWKFFAIMSFKLNSVIFWPIIRFVSCRVLNYKKEDFKERFKSLDETNLSFPFGFIDLNASGLLYTIMLLPTALLPTVININFNSTNGYTIYFIFNSILVLVLMCYNLYFKNKNWIKIEIKKSKKKYSMEHFLRR